MSEVMWSCHLLLERIIATVLTPRKTGLNGKEERGGGEREREREMRESVQRKEGPVDKERRAGDISNAER